MSKWQPIETAPKDNTVVDLYRKGRLCNYVWDARHNCFVPVGAGISVIRDASHWMLPPEPPEAQ